MASGNETVRIVRKPKVDKLSAPSTAEPTGFDIGNVQVVPRRSFEEGRGWVSIEGWDLWCFTEPEQAVLHTDLVKVRGIDYEVDGQPARFDKKGKFKALNIVCKRVGT